MPFSPDQLAAARELQASFSSSNHSTQPRSNQPRRQRGQRGQNGGGRSGPGNTSYRGWYNGPNGYRTAPGHYTAGPARDEPRQNFTSTYGSGSLASSNSQSGGSSYQSARSAPRQPHASGFGSYGSPQTPRVPQPTSTASMSSLKTHGERSNDGAIGAYTHRPPLPSSPHVADTPSKPHGGPGNSRDAIANTEAPPIKPLPALSGDSTSASTTVANGNGQTDQGSQSSIAPRGSKHGGLENCRHANDASESASTVLPVSTTNGSGNAPVTPVASVASVASVAFVANGTNGLAGQGLQASSASQGPQHSGRFTLTAANGFGVDFPSNAVTRSNPSSHIRGMSNTSDVEMIDLDGHTEEGIRPLRVHGGIGESRWAYSEPVPDTRGPATPPMANNDNRHYWRTSNPWPLARYKNPTSTSELAQPTSTAMQTIHKQSARPDSLQSANGTTNHGGLGSSRFA